MKKINRHTTLRLTRILVASLLVLATIGISQVHKSAVYASATPAPTATPKGTPTPTPTGVCVVVITGLGCGLVTPTPTATPKGTPTPTPSTCILAGSCATPAKGTATPKSTPKATPTPVPTPTGTPKATPNLKTPPPPSVPKGTPFVYPTTSVRLPTASSSPTRNILRLIFGVAGGLAFLIIVIAGFQFVTSQGDPQKTTKARNAIVYALVGLVVTVIAFSIVTFVLDNI